MHYKFSLLKDNVRVGVTRSKLLVLVYGSPTENSIIEWLYMAIHAQTFKGIDYCVCMAIHIISYMHQPFLLKCL